VTAFSVLLQKICHSIQPPLRDVRRKALNINKAIALDITKFMIFKVWVLFDSSEYEDEI
jgi:hypothetical protein